MTGSSPVVPGPVRWIAKTLENEGFETWAVGGALRDHLLESPSEDWDLATRARPDEMQRIFRRTVPIGVEHGTVGILGHDGVLHEVTTFRRDVETFGRHATVAFADTLDEDLSRRDFTINALAYHPLRDVWHDPFDGAGDLNRHLLRTVGEPAERFREDYLRILRGLRFAGALGLTIEAETWRALVAGVEKTSSLSPERLREEVEKALSGRARPSGTLALYSAAGVLQHLYAEIATQSYAARGSAEPGESWLSHALLVTDAVRPHRHDLRWAALFYGAGESTEELGAGEGGSEPPERAFRRAAALLERLRSSRARIRAVAAIVRWAAYPPHPDASEAEVRRWCAGVGRETVSDILRLWIASARVDERRGHGLWTGERAVASARRIRAILRSGAPLTIDELALSGDDLIRLGYKPGRHFGRVLDHLLSSCLDDPSLNERTQLESAAHEFMAEEDPRDG